MCVCDAESHKENSQPDVRRVRDDSTVLLSVHQARRTPASPVSHSNGNKDQEAAAAPIKRPSIFGSVALLAESSSSTSSRHRLSSSASPFAVASNVDAPPPPFATPPYTPRSRSYPAYQPAAATPLAAATPTQQQQPLPPRADDLNTSLMTPPSVMTPDNRLQHQRGLRMTYTPPFTPVRPATTTPVGRPRSRLSLNCASPMQDLTRPPSVGSLALVSRLHTAQFIVSR